MRMNTIKNKNPKIRGMLFVKYKNIRNVIAQIMRRMEIIKLSNRL